MIKSIIALVILRLSKIPLTPFSQTYQNLKETTLTICECLFWALVNSYFITMIILSNIYNSKEIALEISLNLSKSIFHKELELITLICHFTKIYFMSVLILERKEDPFNSFTGEKKSKKELEKEISRWEKNILKEFLKHFIRTRLSFHKGVIYNPSRSKSWKNKDLINKISEVINYSPDSNVKFNHKKLEIIKSFRNQKLVNPFPRLPNVSTFKVISLGRYHPVLKWFNIFKRMRPAAFRKTLNSNGRMNKYISRQEKYLNKSVGEPKFWSVGFILLTRSTSFRLAQLRQVFPQ